MSAALQQLQSIIHAYKNILPISSFPWIPLTIAAVFQVFAWFGGIFLSNYTLLPRVLILWLFALGEYTFMSPSMNASIEILNMTEPVLVVIYQVITLVVFIVINTLIFKKQFELKHAISFMLLALAVYIAYMW